MNLLSVCYTTSNAPQLVLDNIPQVFQKVLGTHVAIKAEQLGAALSSKAYNFGCLVIKGKKFGSPKWGVFAEKLVSLKQFTPNVVVVVVGDSRQSAFKKLGDIEQWKRHKRLSPHLTNVIIMTYDGNPEHLYTYQHNEEVKRFIEGWQLVAAEQKGSTPRSQVPVTLAAPISDTIRNQLVEQQKKSKVILDYKDDPKHRESALRFIPNHQKETLVNLRKLGLNPPLINIYEANDDRIFENQRTLLDYIENLLKYEKGCSRNC